MIRKLLCWLGFHELISCCDYCCKFIEDADCGKCSYFMFEDTVKICKHCGKVK